ncbi:MAG: glycosyltransferase family 4 protein [Rhodospirillales bacterium]|nr:glycosyltransferase family 4 protein [Rhodospirillales bacterium]
MRNKKRGDGLRKKKFLIVTSEDWYFCSHRLPMAKAAQSLGLDVVVVTRAGAHVQTIKDMGFRHISLRLFTRSNVNILRNFGSILELFWLYFKERPDIVLHVSLKVSVFGMIALSVLKNTATLNLVPGVGRLAIVDHALISILRIVLWKTLRLLFRQKGALLVVQNQDNWDFFVNRGIVAATQVALVRGSGVDTAVFSPQPESEPLTVAFVGRLLWSKGVGELVEAAEILRRRGVDVKVVLVGVPDYTNWHYIPLQMLARWQEDGIVEWWGYQDNIVDVWQRAAIGVFPTFYGEGISKALLEAGSCARPVITTNIGSGQDLVVDGVSGLVIPARDPEALSRAIQRLVEGPGERMQLGSELRARIEKQFDNQHVVATMRKLISQQLTDAMET